MSAKPLTLNDFEDQLKKCRELGADGSELVFIESSVITGFEGLTIKTRGIARHVGLCEPVGIDQRIINIWGVPE